MVWESNMQQIFKSFPRDCFDENGYFIKPSTSVEVSEEIERQVKNRKPIITNVDFYSAPLLYGLDIPTDLFTPLFAMSRIAGWTAHVLEQYKNNRLIRPRARYVGQIDRTFRPIEQR